MNQFPQTPEIFAAQDAPQLPWAPVATGKNLQSEKF
jgi:hypothetical protein